jgi:hypothetical protein
MFEEYENKKKKQVSLMRSLLDYGMGLVIFCLGIFFFCRSMFNLPINKSYPPDYVDKILGGIFIVYGAWRTYRGYKKNYFK